MKKIIPDTLQESNTIELSKLLANPDNNFLIIYAGVNGELYKATRLCTDLYDDVEKYAFVELEGMHLYASGIYNSLRELLENAFKFRNNVFVFESFTEFVGWYIQRKGGL